MSRGGARSGSGPKKGVKYRPRDKTGVRSVKKDKLLKKLMGVLRHRIVVLKKIAVRERLLDTVYTCSHCGVLWKKETITQGPKKYCSEKCQRLAQEIKGLRWKPVTCKICGKVFLSQSSHVTKHCMACAPKAIAERHAQRRKTYICKKCGKPFQRVNRPQDMHVFCSRKCAGTGEPGKSTGPKQWTFGNTRSKAKALGVVYESVNPRKVFERDGWRCWICGRKLLESDRGMVKPEAPEIDHVIPMSTGGPHTYGNTKACCRRCNCAKLDEDFSFLE